MAFNFSKEEEKILEFWKEQGVFEQSLKQTEDQKAFVFYDGPPFATGLPHHGHILSSVIKDVIPRYKTMRGFYVRRRWGWDCHGLPIENLVEKEIGISGKKEIESKIGIAKFNELCRSKVLTYTKEWGRMVNRIGRWVDFDNSYKTMDPTYMESIWWALKTLWDKGLIYEGKKVLMYCPHCETPVSKAEVAMDNSYKDVTEESVVVKFKVNSPEQYNLPAKSYLLAWTTTPWTLPGNVALAVGENIDYAVVTENGENYVVAKERVPHIFKDAKIDRETKGIELVGLQYEPLFDIKEIRNSGKRVWHVAAADFVTTEDGTGIVHTAVMYGEDDYQLGLKLGLPMLPLLDSKGVFNEDAPKLIQGKYFKQAEKEIKADLESRKLLFSRQQTTHPYPFCWRCGTQLFYNAISAWFINIQKDKQRMIKLNEKVNWYPGHLKEGRFLNILEGAPDWNISRNRYWATPLPFFKCECGKVACIGSVSELKEKATNFSEVYATDKVEDMDLHKDKMDQIKMKCDDCGQVMHRIPEVIDCWVESASMPFAELHFPFENKDLFQSRFPAQYIAEYIAQTRTWFYYMHVLGTLLFGDKAFENVVTTGTILNEKGEKLSKSKMNYTDPWAIIEQYGVDALRFYLMGSSVMGAEDLFFQDRDVRESYNNVINTLGNTAVFYQTYGGGNQGEISRKAPKNILDNWIVSRLQQTIEDITLSMDGYDTIKTCRYIRSFTEDLSLWYVRRSRPRFKEEGPEKEEATRVLRWVLADFAKVIAPVLPFTAEFVFKIVRDGQSKLSVHLEAWPEVQKKLIDAELEDKMEEVRRVVTQALAERAAKAIKVRQPLASLSIKNEKSKLQKESEFLELVKDEVNVKEVLFNSTIEKDVQLDTTITAELRAEGDIREAIRIGNDLRKEGGYKVGVMVNLTGTASIYNSPDIQKTLQINYTLLGSVSEIPSGAIKKEVKEGEETRYVAVNPEK